MQIQLCVGPGNSEGLPGSIWPCLSYPRGQEATSYLIPEPRALAHGGWLVLPVPRNRTASTGIQCSHSSKFTPVRQNHLLLLFPFFLLCFRLAPFHTFFCRDISKVQNPEREPGRRGAMGSKLQHIPFSLPGHNHATPIPGEACSQPLNFSQSTKPVQQETGLPALTCPRNAALVRNVSGKAEGPWNQSLSLGTYPTGMCKAGRGVRVDRGGLCWLVEECTLASSLNDKGWFSAEKP